MLKRKLDVKVSIWNTQYTLTCHRDGSVTVLTPYVRWKNNEGCLAFYKVTMGGNDAEAIKMFFKCQVLFLYANNRYQGISLDDVLEGNLHDGVKVFSSYSLFLKGEGE